MYCFVSLDLVSARCYCVHAAPGVLSRRLPQCIEYYCRKYKIPNVACRIYMPCYDGPARYAVRCHNREALECVFHCNSVRLQRPSLSDQETHGC